MRASRKEGVYALFLPLTIGPCVSFWPTVLSTLIRQISFEQCALLHLGQQILQMLTKLCSYVAIPSSWSIVQAV